MGWRYLRQAVLLAALAVGISPRLVLALGVCAGGTESGFACRQAADCPSGGSCVLETYYPFLSSFESQGNDDSGTAKDPHDLDETFSGSGVTDATLHVQQTTVYDERNGGHETSEWSAQLTISANTDIAYYTINDGLSGDVFDPVGTGYGALAAGIALHVETVPGSGARALLGFQESSVNDWGCFAEITSGRDVEVYYHVGDGTETCSIDTDCRNGTLCASDDTTCVCQAGPSAPTTGRCAKRINSATITVRADSCSADRTRPCTTGTKAEDCPDPVGCGDGDVAGGCTGTEDCHFFPTLELAQRNVSQGSVICDLWLNGEPLTTNATTTILPQGVGTISDVGIGALPIGTRSGGSWLFHFDDLRTNEDITTQAMPRTGHGYLVTLHPSQDSSEQTWTLNDCCVGSTCSGSVCTGGPRIGLSCSVNADCCVAASSHIDCVDDFRAGGAIDETSPTNWLRRRTDMNRRESFCGFTEPTIDQSGGERIVTVDVQTYMQPGPTTTWRGNFAGIMQCPLCEEGGATVNEVYSCVGRCDSGTRNTLTCTVGVCVGGASAGANCDRAEDCPSGTCTVSTHASTGCPGTAACTANVCTAGINEDLACTSAADCPATCETLCEGSEETLTTRTCTDSDDLSCSCDSTVSRAFNYQTSSAEKFYYFRLGRDQPPSGVTIWTPDGVAQLGFYIETARGYCSNAVTTPCTDDGDCSGGGVCTGGLQTGSGGEFNRLEAVLAHAYVRRPEQALPVTLGDHNVGAEDGLISILLWGDSTLTGTSSSICVGGSTPGVLCSQQDYCSWDPFRRDKPFGGCAGDDARCRTCTDTQGDNFGNGGGAACETDDDCTGTCAGSPGACTTAAIVGQPCTVDDDCDVGLCDDTAECLESCPGGGSCPSHGNYGWSAGVIGNVNADSITSCAVGGETALGSLFQRSGQSIGMRPFKWTAGYGQVGYACNLIQGTAGRCSCISAAHCGTGGTCLDFAGGACTAGEYCRCTAGTKSTCGNFGDCTLLHCLAPPPDLIIGLIGYNDCGGGLDSAAQSTVPGYGKLSTPECDTPFGTRSFAAVRATVTAARQQLGILAPPATCPGIGQPSLTGGAAYQCAQTPCSQHSDCAGVSPNSRCLGVCDNTAMPCFGDVRISGPGAFIWGCDDYAGGNKTCSMQNIPCDFDVDCPTFDTAQTCSGGLGRKSTERRGTCACDDTTTHTDCPEGVCVGGANDGDPCHTQAQCTGGMCDDGFVCHSGACRRSCNDTADITLACTDDATCTDLFCVGGARHGLACTTAAECFDTACLPGGMCSGGVCQSLTSCDTGNGVQRGVCTCPCDAITCTQDRDCGNVRIGPDGHGPAPGTYLPKAIAAAPGFVTGVPNVATPVPDDIYHMRSSQRGLCNRYADGDADADGKCRCCGTLSCGDPQLEPRHGGGCSCLVAADCQIGTGTCDETAATCAGGADDGEACTTKADCPDGECVGVCTGTTFACRHDAECNGDCNASTFTCDPLFSGNYRSRRGLCQRDADCAAGHDCINCMERFLQARRMYQRSQLHAMLLSQQIIDEFGEGCECTGNADCSPACVAGRCGATRTTCGTDADCVGVCTSGECATGPRRTCRSSSDCAAEQGCTAPRLMWSEPLLVGGSVTAASYFDPTNMAGVGQRDIFAIAPARDCNPWRINILAEGAGADEQQFDGFWTNLLRLDPRLPRHLTVNQSTANRDRVFGAYHVADAGHYAYDGAVHVGENVARAVEKLNVCLTTATGEVQRYCRKGNDDFEDPAEPCTENVDCAFRCTARRCDQDPDNCPLETDYCGPD